MLGQTEYTSITRVANTMLGQTEYTSITRVPNTMLGQTRNAIPLL